MTQASISSTDLKVLADAAMELVKLKKGDSVKSEAIDHQKLLQACSSAYSFIQDATKVFGVYRCPKCGSDWRCTDMGQAQRCVHCSHENIEPVYASAVNDIDHFAVVNALAKHEKEYPSKLQQGEYDIVVTRTGYSQKTLKVTALGPASAELAALDQAGDEVFRPEHSSSYEADGVAAFSPGSVVGETFLREYPLSEEIPSENVTVKEVLENGVVRCSNSSGEVTEVFLSELKPI